MIRRLTVCLAALQGEQVWMPQRVADEIKAAPSPSAWCASGTATPGAGHVVVDSLARAAVPVAPECPGIVVAKRPLCVLALSEGVEYVRRAVVVVVVCEREVRTFRLRPLPMRVA